MTGTCSTCRYFYALNPECRRRPPVAFPMAVGPGKYGAFSVFPPTQPTHWCGKYKADLVTPQVTPERPS